MLTRHVRTHLVLALLPLERSAPLPLRFHVAQRHDGLGVPLRRRHLKPMRRHRLVRGHPQAVEVETPQAVLRFRVALVRRVRPPFCPTKKENRFDEVNCDR